VYFPWIPSERKRMMQISDLLLPNSRSEARQLTQFFGIPPDKIRVIPNAVDEGFSKATADAFHEKYGIRDFVLTVGRIEPRKNQLGMIRAMNKLSVPYVIIGDYVSHYQDYYNQCRKEAGSHVHFLGKITHDNGLLASAYAACKTFLLATWLETPGLAAMEAALAGANIVITQEGATKEYFGEFADYVDPCQMNQIQEAVLSSQAKNKNALLGKHIQTNFQWTVTAQKTFEAYQSIS
jgi:glycosyltransferase involved in cell wall biosynthesis